LAGVSGLICVACADRFPRRWLHLMVPIAIILLFSFNHPRGRFNFLWHGFSLDAWKHPFAVEVAQAEVCGAAPLEQRQNRLGHDVARRELGVGVNAGHEAAAGAVHELRSFAPDRLGNQKRPAAAGQRRGVKLDEFHVAHDGSGPVGEGDPVADRPRRIGRAGEEGARASGCEQGHAGAGEAKFVVSEQPRAGAVVVAARQGDGGGVLEHLDPRFCDDAGDQRRGDGGSGGGTSRMQDAAAAVAALAPELVSPGGVAVEPHAHPLEVGDARRAFLGERVHGPRIAQAAPDLHRVGGVPFEPVVGADRRRHPALGHV